MVTGRRVRLTGPGIDVAADHGGVRAALAEAINETRRFRARVGLQVRPPASQMPGGEPPTARAGWLLGESFLPELVRGELGRALAAAGEAYQPVRLGLAVPPELAGLPGDAAVPRRPGPAGSPPAGPPLPEDGRGNGPGFARAPAHRGRYRLA